MLQNKIKEDLIAALKSKDELRLMVLRGLSASFTNELVATKRKTDEELKDEEIVSLIQRAVKQRKEAADQFKKGGRNDLVEQEDKEREILESYLPEMMSKEDIESFAKAKKEESNIENQGQLMGLLMKELRGKADGSLVKEVVDQLF